MAQQCFAFPSIIYEAFVFQGPSDFEFPKFVADKLGNYEKDLPERKLVFVRKVERRLSGFLE